MALLRLRNTSTSHSGKKRKKALVGVSSQKLNLPAHHDKSSDNTETSARTTESKSFFECFLNLSLIRAGCRQEDLVELEIGLRGDR